MEGTQKGIDLLCLWSTHLGIIIQIIKFTVKLILKTKFISNVLGVDYFMILRLGKKKWDF